MACSGLVTGVVVVWWWQGCPRNEINSCRRRIVVDQQTTTVIVDEFFFRHPVEIVVDKGKNSIKLSIGVVDENTIPQNVR